ncbi:MAG TPA: DUF4268 domain-containing protein [Acidimicrobiales bacterium]|nr:DUF4268 domain-containing protein [Acidimicrobiales bacterium]
MELGRLEHVPARDVWGNEAYDFTPWLLGNAERLGEALGIDIELQVAEHPVGGFSLDLIGRDLADEGALIIENQLGGTDHGHLGQLLTYAAGTGAKTIIWLATAFREEHRQALDWLNEQTAEDVRFFGVQLRVVRIGNSLPAPLFEVVAKPNDWQKQVRSTARGAGTGGKAERYVRFWERYLARVHAAHPEWSRRRTPQSTNWMGFPSPIPGTQITPSFAAGGRLRHELYIDSGDVATNENVFAGLLARKDEFEQVYGRPLSWEELPGKRASRIADYSTGDVLEEQAWEAYIDWFVECGERLRAAIAATVINRSS